MIEKSNRHRTLLTWGQQSLYANFYCQSKGHSEVLYGEKTNKTKFSDVE